MEVTTDVDEFGYEGPTRVLRIEGIPLPVALAFKAKAASQDTTMAELVRRMIAKAVR